MRHRRNKLWHSRDMSTIWGRRTTLLALTRWLRSDRFVYDSDRNLCGVGGSISFVA